MSNVLVAFLDIFSQMTSILETFVQTLFPVKKFGSVSFIQMLLYMNSFGTRKFSGQAFFHPIFKY